MISAGQACEGLPSFSKIGYQKKIDMDNLHIPITGDNQNFINALNGAKKGVRETAKEIEKSGATIEEYFERIQQAAALSLAGFSVKEFIQKVVQVRGEFQQLEVAFTTMLGSAEKANALMQQLVNTAAKTPFDLQGVAEGAKQLLAYGEAAENINEDLNRLGNIAAGMSLPLSDLIYLYGTTMSQGRLYARDVLQFSGRGIPLVQELQKQFGATREEINKMVSEGKIGFPQVKAAIVSMTSSGGQFYNLMEEQSKTITGQISNLQDSLDMMFNEIGKKSEGIINDAISAASFLVEHYEQIGNVLKPLVISYGAYKAALIATAAVENLIAAGRSVKYFALLTTRIGAATAAQRAFNVAALKNPYVILGAAAASLIVTLAVLSTRTNEYTEELEKANRKLEEQKKQLAELDEQKDYMTEVNKKVAQSTADQINKVEVLKSAIEDETNSIEDRKKAIREMQAIVPNYEASLNEEGRLYVKNKSAVDDYIESLKQLAIAKALQSKREELTAQQIDAELNRRQAVRDRKKAADEARDAARATEKARRKRDEANERDRRMRGGGLMAGYEENIIASRADDLMNSRPVQLAMDAEAAANAKLRVAQNAVTIADKTILTTSNQIRELDALLKDYKNKGLLPEERTATTPTASTTPRTPKVTKEDPRIRNEKEIAKAILDLQDANEKEQIDLMEDGTEKRLALSKYEYEQRKEELDRQHKELVSKRGGNLTEDEEKSFTDARLLNERRYQDEVKDIISEEFELRQRDMSEYLEQYGTYQQQKLAIETEYAKKIKNARSEGEKLSLQAERNNKIASIDANQMAMNVDWSASFRGVGNVLSEIARETLREVKAYMEKDEFKILSPEGKKAYTDLAAKLQQEGAGEATSPFNFKIWGTIAKNVEDYQKSVVALKNAEDEHTQAVERRKKAEEDLQKAVTEDAKIIAQANLEKAKVDEDETAEAQRKAEEKKNQSQQELSENTDKASKGLNDFTSALNEVSNGSLYGFANGITKLVSSIGGASKGLSELGKVGGIIGAILQIIDALGDDPAQFIKDLLDKIANVIEKVLEDLPQIIVNALEGVGNIVTGVVKGVAGIFGADLSGIFGGGTENFDAAVEKWGWLLDTWKDNLQYEKELMKEAYGTKVTDIQRKTEADLRQTQRAAASAYRGWASDGAGLFSHSNGYNANQDAKWNYLWQYDKELAKRMGGDISNLFNLSAKELKELKHNNSQFWQSLSEKARKYLDQIIELEDEIEQLRVETMEQLTATSFDSIVSDFQNALINMDASAEDLADNFEKYMKSAVFNSLMLSNYKKQLEEWYKAFAGAMESEDMLTAEEQEQLRKQYEAIVNSAINERDALRSAMNWTGDNSTYNQDASKGGWQSLGEETGQELNGRFAALQVSGEKIADGIGKNTETLADIATLGRERNTTISEIRNLMIFTNAFLEDIKDINRSYYAKFEKELAAIKRAIG